MQPLPTARSLVGLALIAGVFSPLLLATRRVRLPAETTTTPIMGVHGEVLVTYKATTATPVQDAWPGPLQRAVQVDGMLRSPPAVGMSIAANPFEEAWRAPSIGGMNLALGTYAVQDVDIALPAEGHSWIVGKRPSA